MARMKPRNPNLIPDGKGGLRVETIEEEKERLEKEYQKRELEELKRIMCNGFTREQAEYLLELEYKIKKASRTYVPPPRY